MFLHLGNNYIINKNDIIGIFNIKQKRSNIYKFFLKPKLGEKNVVDLTNKFEPGSCILTTDKIILSSIASQTLKNR